MRIGTLEFKQTWEVDLGPNRSMEFRIVKDDVSSYSIQKKHRALTEWKVEKSGILFLSEASATLEKWLTEGRL